MDTLEGTDDIQTQLFNLCIILPSLTGKRHIVYRYFIGWTSIHFACRSTVHVHIRTTSIVRTVPRTRAKPESAGVFACLPVPSFSKGLVSAVGTAMLAKSALRGSLRSAWHHYSALLAERPIQTKTASGISVTALGDAMVQAQSFQRTAHDSSFTLDLRRTARQASFSMLMAPTAHFWFACLSRFRPGVALLIDQLTFAPAANVLYLSWTFAWREGRLQGCYQEVKSKLWSALQASYLVWPAAMFLNFHFVPLNFRVLFTNCVGFWYGAFMTYLANDCEVSMSMGESIWHDTSMRERRLSKGNQ